MVKESEEAKKLRGGFYTPAPIADFISKWAVQPSHKSVLEPSCGDGNIAVSLANVLTSEQRLTAVELSKDEAKQANERLKAGPLSKNQWTVVNQDFFKFYSEKFRWENERFDCIVGNPPYIRYQHFDRKQREIGLEILKSVGLPQTKLMNAWMPFLIGSSQLLSSHGRLAMVLPATLLQVKFAGPLRKYLSETFHRLTIVTFEKLLFEGVQEEVILLLGEKNGHDESMIRFVALESDKDLLKYSDVEKLLAVEPAELDHTTEKWTRYYLSAAELELLRNIESSPTVRQIGDFAKVQVGIVTGRNQFFVLNKKKASEEGLIEHCIPLVGRSAHLGPGIVYSGVEHEESTRNGNKTLMLNLPGVGKDKLSSEVVDYIDWGESEGFHKGYKCSIRDPWYEVPSVWIPDGFVLRQIHEYPKFVYNSTQATCTDTIHRMKIVEDVDAAKLITATHNSLTWALSEIYGRSYGGGVLELEPNEAEKLLVPFEGLNQLDLNRADEALRANGPYALLDYVDDILLVQGMGLKPSEVKTLRGVWEKLRDRRINRK